jgi:hypothetical protein
MKTIITICHMPLTEIYHIFTKSEPYNSKLFRYADKPPMSRYREVSTDEAISYLAAAWIYR